MVTLQHRTLSLDAVHYVWDNRLSAAIEVAPGETITIYTRDAADRQIRPGAPPSRLRSIDFGRMWPLAGPIAVRGARPGDAVVIDIIRLEPGAHGWTAVIPERGLLRGEITGPYLHHWEIAPDRPYVELRRGVRVPVAPFLGVIGCAPAEIGTTSPLPPRAVGGKLDLPLLTAGSRITLPVEVAGALLSVGHGRAAQGHGEVCGTAVECDMTAMLRFDVLPGRAPAAPVVELAEPPARLAGPRFVTTGSAGDLLDAARAATRAMVAYLRGEHRMSREVAYVLCSVAADLSIAQAVNVPHWTAAMTLPLALFSNQ